MSTFSSAAAEITRVPVLADGLAKSRAQTAVLVLGGALFTALLAQITIPMHPVPMTGQTLGVMLVGSALGAHRGAASLTLYVLMGFLLPVYADGGSGLETIWGATGGYLIGFIVAAYFVGWMAEHGSDRRVLTAFISFVVGQLIIFVPGVAVLHAATGLSWSEAIHGGFTVFIIGGLVKAAFGALLVPTAWKLQKHSFGSR